LVSLLAGSGFGVLPFQIVQVLMGMAFFWLHLHVWSELAFGRVAPRDAVALGLLRSLDHAAQLPGALLRLPGRVMERLRGRGQPEIGSGELATSMVMIYAASGLCGTFVGVALQFAGLHFYSAGAGSAGMGILACGLMAFSNLAVLSLGLGRWSFFDLAERHRGLSPGTPVRELLGPS
jgi:hypothetical protein